MAHTIVDYDRALGSEERRIRKAPISQKNKSLILAFRDECLANGLSKGRVLKYLHTCRKFACWLRHDFDRAGIEDIKVVVARIEQQPLVDFTKKQEKTILRKLYRWLRGTEGYPPEVEWISLRCRSGANIKLPEELLTEEDILRLIRAAKTPRDRAFVAMLYETGCRISELLFVKVKHVRFDEYGACLVVDGKTGPRRIRVISAVPYLTEWLNAHPDKDDPAAWLWCGPHGACFKYTAVLSLVKRLVRRAGLKKHVHPHLFRHSRATFLANHLKEAQMKEYFGWVRASEMAAVYVHLSGRDVDNALLELYGIARDEDEVRKTRLRPKPCARCELTNPATHSFCQRCGHPLDGEVAIRVIQEQIDRKEADDLLDTMLHDPKFKEVFLNKVREMLKSSQTRDSSQTE